MGLRRLLTVMGFGAGLMYFYDPDQGNRRRALMRDQWNRFMNDGQDFFSSAKLDLQNRRQGMKDQPLTGGLGGLSGDWTPGLRLVAALAGGGMTFYGLAKSGISGVAATFLGMNLVARSVFNRDMSGATEAMREQFEQAKTTEKRDSNGQRAGRQEQGSTAGSSGSRRQSSGVDASLTSEEGASSRRNRGKDPSTGVAEDTGVEDSLGDESVGFDSMLPGNPPEGEEQ